jgi:Flp pilus assembly protein TadG
LVWIILPMLGLFVDLGILYSAKARLQAAVDGAALAAARALNLGSSTASQAVAAQQNAVNWFYANFPSGNWATTGTVMSTSNVTVVDSPNQANLRQVTVTASTNVPTWFMKYLGFNLTALTVTGQASRKDVVAMLVLDRSGSMCSINGVLQSQPCGEGSGTACDAMITAAKNFTGAFAATRDQIGMLTFSDGYYLDSKPVTTFQTKLGYSNSSNSGTGSIDNIQCGGGTGTAAAVSLAYNELYKIAEPGAMNILMLETDGLPNTLIYNFWDSTNNVSAVQPGSNGSNCQDQNSKTVAQGGWTTSASMRTWLPSAISMNTGGTGYMSDVASGAIGAFYTADPAQKASSGPYNILLFNPMQTSDSNSSGNSIAAAAKNCAFDGSTTSDYSDIKWLPSRDVFGNQVAPTNEYQSLTLTGSHNVLTGPGAKSHGVYASNDWTATHAAALNATDNAAYNARANATLAAYVYVIGLGGNNGDPPDAVLLQRMANDPNGDQFNSTANAAFDPCSTEPTCITYPNQPQGQFIYAPTAAQLGSAFLAISSQILRLSH